MKLLLSIVLCFVCLSAQAVDKVLGVLSQGYSWDGTTTRVLAWGGAAPVIGPDPSDPSLKAYYQMENTNWTDTISGTNATAVNGPTLTNDCKHGTGALKVHGNTPKDYLVAVNASLLNGATGCTFACWVKLDTSFVTWGGIVDAFKEANNEYLGINQDNANAARVVVGDTDLTYSLAAIPSALAGTTWYHIASTWDTGDGKCRIYTNGILSATATLTKTDAIVQSHAFWIGAEDYSLNNRYTIGTIDDVAIYNRALTSNEVRTLYLSYP